MTHLFDILYLFYFFLEKLCNFIISNDNYYQKQLIYILHTNIFKLDNNFIYNFYYKQFVHILYINFFGLLY